MNDRAKKYFTEAQFNLASMYGNSLETAKVAMLGDPRSIRFLELPADATIEDIDLKYYENRSPLFSKKVDLLCAAFDQAVMIATPKDHIVHDAVVADTQRNLHGLARRTSKKVTKGILQAIDEYAQKLMGGEFSPKPERLS